MMARHSNPLGALALLAALLAGGAAAQPGTAPSVAVTTAAVDAAPPVDLRVTHVSRSVGVDGVTRETHYTNRMFRRTGTVWTERELPEGLRASLEHSHPQAHGPHAGHAHDEAQGAPLRITRRADGSELVEVVLDKTRRVIEVDRAHHGNVGYGGSWDAAYWLIAPAQLQRMERVGAVRSGMQRYRGVQGETTTLVDWDVAGQFPRRVERSDAHGTSFYLLTATRLPAPKPEPWAASKGFDRGDYSDLLD